VVNPRLFFLKHFLMLQKKLPTIWHVFLQLNHKQFIMEKHLTTHSINDGVQPQAGNNPLSNNPAGSADIEKGKPAKPLTEKPDIVTPEIEKPDILEVPDTDKPEVEKTDIDEVPDKEIEEMPDTDVPELPGK